jgi:hypothetical protein
LEGAGKSVGFASLLFFQALPKKTFRNFFSLHFPICGAITYLCVSHPFRHFSQKEKRTTPFCFSAGY